LNTSDLWLKIVGAALPLGILYLVIIRVTARRYSLRLRGRNIEMELRPGPSARPGAD
jgi:hypothetical protein